MSGPPDTGSRPQEVQASTASLPALGMVALGVVLVWLGGTELGQAVPLPTSPGVAFGVLGALVAYPGIAGMVNRVRIRVEGDDLVVTTGPLPTIGPNRHRRVPLSHVHAVTAYRRQVDRGLDRTTFEEEVRTITGDAGAAPLVRRMASARRSHRLAAALAEMLGVPDMTPR